MTSILVLEDEPGIRSFIVLNLKRNGYTVIEAETGEEALQQFNEHPEIDIALLDVMLPGIDGFEVCKQIRSKTEQVGIIMLTARTQEVDRVHGLMSGADDYMNKPFSPAELNARIFSLMRRIKGSSPKQAMRSSIFQLNPKTKQAKKHGELIDLTPTEFALLQLFLSRSEEPISRNELLDEVWGVEYVGDPKIVDVNVRRLRKKIEDDPSKPAFLETVWGLGYCWSENKQ
ncbi:response regulator transcription factor [Bacillus solimangrovi]|uniref:DNA-binding response regulator n=1 Tax=Bacillus solimangrovi TaxID=1305675 RepID=A0A1E5LJP4_9BACI|nr:response regulator transcription factor [Bacillus solimangrovi]OEH94319.1 DNA-binding response regulator [Bacillus solimangrovi]